MAKVLKKMKWFLIYTLVFLIVFAGSAIFKMTYKPAWTKQYSVEWSDAIGKVYTDIPYGDQPANTFDIYVPADSSKESYGLVVYLHAGGFTTGDKSDDKEMLQWLASKGYVAVGINYTLRNEDNPEASVYSQSLEIKESISKVVEKAQELGYTIEQMAMGGGSAGHTLAMLYAYRDAATSSVPVKMLFGGVGPSSFYPEDWSNYDFNKGTDEANQAAAYLFGVMAGKDISPELFGTPAYDEAVKDISALLWVDENTVPSLLAYGKHDTVQPYAASVRLDEALTKAGVPHDYLVFEHSGHGLQNDSAMSKLYFEKIVEYLDTYLPINK